MKGKIFQGETRKSEWEVNTLTCSEINNTDKTQVQLGRFLLLGQGRLEIVQCKQVKIEQTATLITLLADREVQL